MSGTQLENSKLTAGIALAPESVTQSKLASGIALASLSVEHSKLTGMLALPSDELQISKLLAMVALITPIIPPTPTAAGVTSSAPLGGYRGIVGLNWKGNTLIGDAYSGVVGLADFENFSEYGNPMLAQIVSPPIQSDRKRIFMKRFEVDVESGVGLTTGQGSNPNWMLDWSKDGGRTWSQLQEWRSMGMLGAYQQRLRWLRMGQSRQWLLRLQSSDPVRRVIVGFYYDVEEGMG